MGFSFTPPAYPTRVRTTPSRLPNRESVPQNQPRAKVAVSVLIGAEASMGGIVALGTILFSLSVVLVLLQPNKKAGKTRAITDIETKSLINMLLASRVHFVLMLF